MAWVCLLTSWWTPATDTTVLSFWGIEQRDPNFTLLNLPFGRLQWDCSPFTFTAIYCSNIQHSPFDSAYSMSLLPIWFDLIKYLGQICLAADIKQYSMI